jgi:hypothetical protein
MEYPHWMIVAGAVLVAIGFIGLGFRRNRDVEPDQEPTHEPMEMKANWKRERDKRDSDDASLPPWPWRPPPQAR